MRAVLCSVVVATATCPALFSQQGATANVDLQPALSGDWVGVLEYRDYSEPAGSTKQVQLPT